MAQIRYRANLSAKDFSFLIDQWGRSVIVKQFDQNFSRQIVSPTDPDKDIGIPQIFYCHNVMPSAQGFQSIGYFQNNASSGISGLSQIRTYNNPDGSNGYLAFQVVGTSVNVYSCESGNGPFIFRQTLAWGATGFSYKITTATLQGQTYIYIPLVGCYQYVESSHSLVAVTLTGLNEALTIGICDSFGYMIAFSAESIAWSSTLSPIDFTPSLITGAGGGGVTDIKSQIYVVIKNIYGFTIFSDQNCVSAIYSGNTRFPFNFKPVIGGGGVVDNELVGIDSESGNLYAWTTYGLQLVSVQQAQISFPELTNFIGGNLFEDIDDGTLTYSLTEITGGTMVKKLTVISGRYLVISYGLTEFTHALVYDIGMRRWGKLKTTHVNVFELVYGGFQPDQRARGALAFVATDGTVNSVQFVLNASSSAQAFGIMILGKYQHARDRMITLQQVDISSINNSAAAAIYVMSTLDGKTFLPNVGLTVGQNSPPGGQLQYPCRITGMNHSLMVVGAFDLNSLMLTYIPNGRR